MTLAGCQKKAGAGGVAQYTLIKWGSPRPISDRVTGEKYVLPDGWKEAVAGVAKIKVSNFGATQHDPATVTNGRRFQELTGIEVEILPWAEPPIVAKTVSIFSAKSDAVDVLCYDHPTTYMQMVGGGWLHPIDELWADENLWKFYAGPLKKGLTADDGHIYGSIGQTKTEMLFYRPSLIKTAPATWQEVRENAKKVTRRDVWGYVFAAGGEMDIVYPFRAMVYSQGGRIVDTRRQRLVVNTPEGRNAWKMLTDMVLVDKSAPSSVVEYSWMQASDMFAVGKAAMVLTHTVDANRFKDPKAAPGIKDDWAVTPPPKWDASQPDTNRASYFDIDGYMVNRFINDKQKAAAMLFIDYMRSYEASAHELIDEGNEAAVLTVYDSPAGKKVPVPDGRKAAMANAVLETFPPAGRALTDLMKEYFAKVVGGALDATKALDELQARLDDYAVPEK
jgi:ABC-type glycerol-3-phosphate transport system substrate-binding protein